MRTNRRGGDSSHVKLLLPRSPAALTRAPGCLWALQRPSEPRHLSRTHHRPFASMIRDTAPYSVLAGRSVHVMSDRVAPGIEEPSLRDGLRPGAAASVYL